MTELNLPTQLGRFPISGELGRGGMGIVYRGTDPSLGRAVAIKVLPRDAGQDGERLHRFEREARVLASVAHPNIAAIHSLEHADDGALLLVLELVEGESLSDRLKRGALPLDEALRTGEAIARAIEAAHGRGVIHRDLKPDNIRITPEGEVKVLDFGLALVEDASRDNATPIDATTAFTVDPRAGDAGMILGTPGYLSPEQARAQSVDRRTDIFSFGCVLFEALTGARAFAGATVIDRISAVLSREPDYAALPTTVPPSVRDMLARCLEKDPERRLASMRDVRVVLESGVSERSGAWVPPVAVVKAPNNLPHRLTSFIGRRREVAEVRDLLRGARLLAITGVGGCGKTRLALEVASAFLPDMPGGVWFIELAAVSEPGLVPGSVATALGLRDTAGKSAVDSLREQLAE